MEGKDGSKGVEWDGTKVHLQKRVAHDMRQVVNTQSVAVSSSPPPPLTIPPLPEESRQFTLD